jgi:hypothetical protein
MNSLLQNGSGMISAYAGRGRPGGAEKRFLINLPTFRKMRTVITTLSLTWLLLNVPSLEARGDEPAKPKAKYNAWAPPDKPIRALLWYDSRQGNFKEWAPFCERNRIAWCAVGRDGDDILSDNRLQEIADQLGRPELLNAPIIREGLSSNGGYTIQLTHKYADRMLAGVTTQPLPPPAQGNEAFNFGRMSENVRSLPGSVYDISRSFAVPIFNQTGENDPVCGSVMAYGLDRYARRQNAPWTYFCLPRGGHGNQVPHALAAAWLEAVIAQRLPVDVDLRQGPPKLKPINIADGWLGNPQTLEIAAYADYAGDRTKACWLPDKITAELWQKLGVGMPYDLPEQTIRKPSGLIDKLVIHDPKSNRVVPFEAVHNEPWKIVADLKPGDTGWKPQTAACSVTVIGKVPDVVRGCDWIRPDNAAAAYTGEVLMEFTVTDQATVYVGVDGKLEQRPEWLAAWKDTGESLQGGYLGNERSFRLFAREFPQGTTVKLGPNGMNRDAPKRPDDGPWIYLAIVKPAR